MAPIHRSETLLVQPTGDGYVLARCARCGLQQCALPASVEMQAFLELHACNGQQHVAMWAIQQIVNERHRIA